MHTVQLTAVCDPLLPLHIGGTCERSVFHNPCSHDRYEAGLCRASIGTGGVGRRPRPKHGSEIRVHEALADTADEAALGNNNCAEMLVERILDNVLVVVSNTNKRRSCGG